MLLDLRDLLWRVDPFVVFLDELDEFLYGFSLRNVKLHWRFVDVEIDFIRRTTDVAEVGVCHFPRTIHNTSHDGDTYALEVASGGTDFLGGICMPAPPINMLLPLGLLSVPKT